MLRLQTVDALVAFDLDDARHAAGGTRLAPDVSEREGALLARAMTYKFAVLGRPLGGAKGLVRAQAHERAVTMPRFCEEIRPLVKSGRFLTGPDLGTYEADFAPLRTPDWEPHVLNSVVDGVAFEDVLTGFGVVAAADAAIGGLDGRRVAVEGFGKVGAGVAREVGRRGGRIVAVSTLAGCVADPAGLDVDALWEERARHGDDLVTQLGRPVLPRDAMFEAETDVLVPGARVGVVDADRAAGIRASAVVPAANVPYTNAGLDALRARGIAAHADFVCNAAAVVGYTSPPHASRAEVLERVEHTIVDLVHTASDYEHGPFAGACAIAEAFLRTWRPAGDAPPGPPLA
ncbi:MAG TPA: Glu/Leu/Phe/Val dehydrogenase dimerization domain-containing protein [Acidimicrobiia bacterium]|nr:Glu/Leu/Phe/Val dehydrogenase dimerization domain-containing protein [Acidimicrobiia bacterium]